MRTTWPIAIQLLLSLFLILELTLAKKSKLPKNVSQHQYCHGCMATMKELIKKLPQSKKKNREVAVMDALERICDNANFREYHYSPPKTVKACQPLIEEYEEDIEKALLNYKGEDLVQQICHDLSGACTGVKLDDKNEKYSDIDLTKDGTVESDGSRSVEIDPKTGGVKNEGKTLSKSDKKKKDKKKKKKKGEKKAKNVIEDVDDGKPSKPGVQKGALHNLNIDINDPDSVKKVMEQINKIKNDVEQDKDEL